MESDKKDKIGALEKPYRESVKSKRGELRKKAGDYMDSEKEKFKSSIGKKYIQGKGGSAGKVLCDSMEVERVVPGN